jgi:hypothetical protein
MRRFALRECQRAAQLTPCSAPRHADVCVEPLDCRLVLPSSDTRRCVSAGGRARPSSPGCTSPTRRGVLMIHPRSTQLCDIIATSSADHSYRFRVASRIDFVSPAAGSPPASRPPAPPATAIQPRDSAGGLYRIRKWAPCSASGPSIRLQSRGVKQI